MHGFELAERRDLVVAGVNAVQITFHWEGPDGPLTQRVTLFERKGTLFTFAGTSAKAEAEKSRPTFDSILASLQLQLQPLPGPNLAAAQ
jgi:hypothetical protein